MSSVYNTAGATLSEKNVGEEYFLNSEALTRGIESGELTFQWRAFHGNSYRLFIRDQIIAFAKTCEPDQSLKSAHDKKMLKQNIIFQHARLDKVTAELNGIDARKSALLDEKLQLETWIALNDPKAAAKAAKDAKEAAKEAKNAEKKRKLA